MAVTPMLESLIPALENWEVPDTHIHFEAFGPASIKRRSAKDAVTDAQNEAVANSTLSNYMITVFQDRHSGMYCRNPGSVDGFELAILATGYPLPGGFDQLKPNLTK